MNMNMTTMNMTTMNMTTMNMTTMNMTTMNMTTTEIMQQKAFRAMGCRVLVALDNDSTVAASYLSPVTGWFEEWEQQLSRFRADSELTRLNQQAGEPQQVSETLWEVFQAARVAAEQSDGMVTPLVLDALEAAGYTESFVSEQAGGGCPTFSAQELLPMSADWRCIASDPQTRTIHLPAGLRLDLGGIAKGWAAEQTVQRLRRKGPVLVDVGGDVALSGKMSAGRRWPIAVADPFAPAEQLELLLLDGGGVATSGRDYRRWQVNGCWQHHIIDPRTGMPAETDVVSVTVIAPTTCAAEMAAKRVLISGCHDGMAWLEEHPTMAGLLVCENGQVVRSHRLKEYVW
jgi:thiamine biosynthesis lipoprotein